MLRNPVTASLLALSTLLIGSVENAEAGQTNQTSIRASNAAPQTSAVQAQNARADRAANRSATTAPVQAATAAAVGAKSFGPNGFHTVSIAANGLPMRTFNGKAFGTGFSWNAQQTWAAHWNHGVPAPFIHAPVICHAPHVHAFNVIFEKQWVDPVFQTVTVGYDHCGTPIHQQMMVKAGYFRTAKFQVCGCGDKVFLGYV